MSMESVVKNVVVMNLKIKFILLHLFIITVNVIGILLLTTESAKPLALLFLGFPYAQVPIAISIFYRITENDYVVETFSRVFMEINSAFYTTTLVIFSRKNSLIPLLAEHSKFLKKRIPSTVVYYIDVDPKPIVLDYNMFWFYPFKFVLRFLAKKYYYELHLYSVKQFSSMYDLDGFRVLESEQYSERILDDVVSVLKFYIQDLYGFGIVLFRSESEAVIFKLTN